MAEWVWGSPALHVKIIIWVPWSWQRCLCLSTSSEAGLGRHFGIWGQRTESPLSCQFIFFFFFLLYPVLAWEIESCHSSLALTLVWQLNLVSFVPDLDFHILPYSRPVGRPLDVHRTSWMGRSCEMAGHSVLISVLIMVVFQGYWDLMLFFYSVLDCILKGVVSLFDL